MMHIAQKQKIEGTGDKDVICAILRFIPLGSDRKSEVYKKIKILFSQRCSMKLYKTNYTATMFWRIIKMFPRLTFRRALRVPSADDLNFIKESGRTLIKANAILQFAFMTSVPKYM